ncbi:MAG TPA: hypothetical protein VNI57_10195, partial [Candidatus Saccharimonadales bacterium]|nr:hypothetical protein [Candidatus Saccharimonadales bacterium]
WALLGAGLVLCLGGALLNNRWMLDRFVDLPLPAAALEVKAKDLVRELGQDAPAGDRAHGFKSDRKGIEWIGKNDQSVDRWETLRDIRPSPLEFWYRQSPETMLAWPNFSVVSYDRPPQDVSGMARVALDPRGRLDSFEAVPAAYDDSKGPWPSPDWSLLFGRAGLDISTFKEVPPVWTPAMASDVQAAWEGPDPERPDLTLHVEAAGYHGRPVSFALRGPWVKPPKMGSGKLGLLEWIQRDLGLALLTIGVLAVGIFLARRNVKAGRGDTRGALRLAFWFFIAHTIVWALWVSHVPDLNIEWKIIQADVGYNLFLAANLGLLYLGLEPYVRRRWPDSIISWSRILRGRFKDPLVGRDTLVGGILGGVFILLTQSGYIGATLLGRPFPEPEGMNILMLGSVTSAVGRTLDIGVHALLDVMRVLFLLLLLRILLRRLWLAVPVFVVCFTLIVGSQANGMPLVIWPVTILMVSIFTYVLIRHGLVAATVGSFVIAAMKDLGLRADLTLWYAPQQLVPVIAVVALLVWGFKNS